MGFQSAEDIGHRPAACPGGQLPDLDISDILDAYYDGSDELASLEKTEATQPEVQPPLPPRPNTLPLIATITNPSPVTLADATIADENGASKSFWQTALNETIYFAGGLISHPFESTKHFSILRHSSGLVYYKGPSTRVAITIFSDAPLPAGRSLWLQRKGFSGNMGMNISTMLGTSSNWIDVTPTYEAVPTDVPESDERAWQRDMKKHLKRVAKDKNLSRHTACETCIIRIPASASDGYLRVVLCAGESRKKVLCPSPVFRIASTSTDVSIFRGASLSTMPLEVGLKAASVVGTTVANRYIGPARTLVDGHIQKVAKKCKPGFIVEKAEHIAYAKSGLQNKFQSLEQNFDAARDVRYDQLHAPAILDAPPEVIGVDTGPSTPFPVKISGIVMQGTGQSQALTSIPTANLARVSDDLLMRLSGTYIGWARLEPREGSEGISHGWHEAILAVGLDPHTSPGVVCRNVAAVHIIHDFKSCMFFGAKVKMMIMAQIRPLPVLSRSEQPSVMAKTIAQDIDITLASLSREAWSAEVTAERLKTERLARSMTDKYVEARTHIQKRIDSVPLHLAGVRTAGAEMMDKAHGRGGIFIRR